MTGGPLVKGDVLGISGIPGAFREDFLGPFVNFRKSGGSPGFPAVSRGSRWFPGVSRGFGSFGKFGGSPGFPGVPWGFLG